MTAFQELVHLKRISSVSTTKSTVKSIYFLKQTFVDSLYSMYTTSRNIFKFLLLLVM